MEYQFIEVARVDADHRQILERLRLNALESMRLVPGAQVVVRFMSGREIRLPKGGISLDAWDALEHLTMPEKDEPEEAQFPVE